MSYDLALKYLSDRAVTEATARSAGFYITENAKDLNASFYPRAAMVIPYLDTEGKPTGFERVRYFDPPEIGGKRKKKLRYQQPKGTAPEIYLPHLAGYNWEQIINDPTIPIIITEGEVKATSVFSNTGVATMGLGGVFMFADNKLTLPLLERTNWERRKVFIVFDSDIDTKVGVQLAEARLVQWLVKQRAHVHPCRLPPSASGEKQGADDFIAALGPEPFLMAMQEASSLTAMDIRVIEMNNEVAYLDFEEKIIELNTGNLIRKDSFTNGSRYSTLTVAIQGPNGLKHIRVANTWLTHAMATRYVNTEFLPGGDELIHKSDGTYLNSWREQPCIPGDVTMFLDLTRYIFGETLEDEWDWPIKLLAYKAQFQTRKIPLAVMIIGEQGSGKSLWAALARSAFGEYGKSKNGKDLQQDWNGFLESGLLVTIDDVSTRQMKMNIETIRAWISEPRVERHEKFLKNREVDNYSLLIFTSNNRDAGAFAHDDRRFLVIGAPPRDKGTEYYEPIYAWLRSGKAGANIYSYLLDYDLQGWVPPVQAPVTAEKKMAYEESLSPFERLARDMLQSDVNVVVQWLQSAEQWALSIISSPGHAETPRANDILLAIQAFPVRPWYTADELMNMFPHMLTELQNQTRRYSNATLPGKVSTALRNNGIYFLKNTEDPEGFWWKGRKQQFLIICPENSFKRALTQAEFDAAMETMGNYVPGNKFGP